MIIPRRTDEMCVLAEPPLGLDLDGTTVAAEIFASYAVFPNLPSIEADMAGEETRMLREAVSDKVVSKEELNEIKRYAALNHSPTSDRMIRIATLLSSGIHCAKPADLYEFYSL